MWLSNICIECIVNFYTPRLNISITNMDNKTILYFLLGKHTVETKCLDNINYKQLFVISAHYVTSCRKRLNLTVSLSANSADNKLMAFFLVSSKKKSR